MRPICPFSNNISIDIDGFNKKLEAQKELARKNWSGAGGSVTDKIWFEFSKHFTETTGAPGAMQATGIFAHLR